MRKLTFWMALLLIFAIPWENTVVIAGLGTLSRALGLGVAAVWLAGIVLGGRLRHPQPIHFVLLLYVIWNSLSILWSIDVPRTAERIETYLQLFALALIIWEVFTSEVEIQAGLQAYVFGAYVSAGNTLLNYQSSNATNFERYAGDNFDPNDLGLILSLGLPMAWFLGTRAQGLWQALPLKLINYAYIPLGVFAILLTASRTALLTTLPTWIFVLVAIGQMKSRGQKFIVIALIACSLLFLGQMVPASSFSRLATLGEAVSTGDLNAREAVWAEGIDIFLQHPIIGVGSQAFKAAAVDTQHVAHNTAISVLVESGIVGFGLFVTIMAIAFQKAIAQYAKTTLWINLLLVWMIGTLTLTWEHRKPTWLLINLIAASAYLAKKERSQKYRQAPEISVPVLETDTRS